MLALRGGQILLSGGAPAKACCCGSVDCPDIECATDITCGACNEGEQPDQIVISFVGVMPTCSWCYNGPTGPGKRYYRLDGSGADATLNQDPDDPCVYRGTLSGFSVLKCDPSDAADFPADCTPGDDITTSIDVTVTYVGGGGLVTPSILIRFTVADQLFFAPVVPDDGIHSTADLVFFRLGNNNLPDTGGLPCTCTFRYTMYTFEPFNCPGVFPSTDQCIEIYNGYVELRPCS